MRPYTGRARREVWPADTSMRSAPTPRNARAISTESSPRIPAVHPIVRGNAHRHGLFLRPHRAHRGKHLERIAQAIFERAAVLVGALIGERCDETRTAGSRARSAVRASRTRTPAHSAARTNRSRTRIHVGARHRARHLIARTVGNGRGPISGQLPAGSGSFASSQPSWVEPFGPGVPELQRDLRARCGRGRSRRCAATPRRAPPRTCPAQPGEMRASGDTQVISVNTSAAPPCARRRGGRGESRRGCRRPHEYMRHRRDDDAVLQIRSRSANGVNIGGTAAHPRAGGGEPASIRVDVTRIAQAQILVARSAGCGSAGCTRIARARTRCSGGRFRTTRWSCARRSGVLQHLERALGLVGRRARREGRLADECAVRARSRPPARAWCPSRWRSARCARRRRAGPRHVPRSSSGPSSADDARKADPDRRSAQVRRVASSAGGRRASGAKSRSQKAIPSSWGMRVESRGAPRFLGRFDDERRGGAVVLVRVRLEPAVRRFANANVNASKRFFVPSQTNRQRRTSTSCRTRRVARPDAAVAVRRTRRRDRRRNSRAARRRRRFRFRNAGRTPSASQRVLQDASRRLRPMPQKPWPPARSTVRREEDRRCRPSGRRLRSIAAWSAGRLRRGCRASGPRTRRPSRTCRRAVALEDGDVRCSGLPASGRSQEEAGGPAADADHPHGRLAPECLLHQIIMPQASRLLRRGQGLSARDRSRSRGRCRPMLRERPTSPAVRCDRLRICRTRVLERRPQCTRNLSSTAMFPNHCCLVGYAIVRSA